MKKHIIIAIDLLTILYTSCTQTITISEGKLNSEFAQALVDRGYIKDVDNIQLSELEKITELDISYAHLTSLEGIEHFKSLTKFGCSKNDFVYLDVSKNTKLEYLVCGQNKLINLDVSKNTKLELLSCYSNQLTNLDVSKNANLQNLYCDENQLTNLDVSKNTHLMRLNCGDNQLTNLDISKNTHLTSMWCDNNPGNGSKFPVKAWFDNYSIPNTLNIDAKSWEYNGNTITIDFYK